MKVATAASATEIRSLHWFRKGLRLHDNPALLEACKSAHRLYPVFCIDPYFAKPDIVGVNRYNFLLESLQDLDESLRKLGSRLYVLKGKPEEQLQLALQQWKINLITYESDTEPYAKVRDKRLNEIFQAADIQVITFPTHTLNDLERYVSLSKGKISNAYQSFQKLFESIPINDRVRRDLPPPASLPPASPEDLNNADYDVPSLTEMGYDSNQVTTPFHGGEQLGLQRMEEYLQQKKWVLTFSKPNTSPNSLQPSTTVLSPYLKFGCVSAAKFYHGLYEIYHGPSSTASAMKAMGVTPTQPPVSLIGQLLWREFFYLQGYITKGFDRMEGNDQCRQIPWNRDREIIERWKQGQTGFPFVDAIMTQLRLEGWIHHLARHMVACFLTRGDLWQHWEEGVKVFDLYLLDDDWALNNANWQWLSCSNFFYQYFRVYSPIAFGKKTDPSGDYIRKYLPQLARFPDKYIYEPWKAPKAVQEQAGCIIGKDYPRPIVDHDVASKENMGKMKIAYEKQAAEKASSAPSSSSNKGKKKSSVEIEDDEEESQNEEDKKKKESSSTGKRKYTQLKITETVKRNKK